MLYGIYIYSPIYVYIYTVCKGDRTYYIMENICESVFCLWYMATFQLARSKRAKCRQTYLHCSSILAIYLYLLYLVSFLPHINLKVRRAGRPRCYQSETTWFFAIERNGMELHYHHTRHGRPSRSFWDALGQHNCFSIRWTVGRQGGKSGMARVQMRLEEESIAKIYRWIQLKSVHRVKREQRDKRDGKKKQKQNRWKRKSAECKVSRS